MSRDPSPTPVELIVRKRDGGTLSRQQIELLVRGVIEGRVPDYQMTAFLMATFFRGMTEEETRALTDVMLHSGRVLSLRTIRGPKVDKHSTGGVGDKISICLGPLVAACGAAVPMVSGRGLGHTGGTLDKLEAIPGYQVAIGARRFESIVRKVGVSIMGQTEELAPADRRIYALRDVTGTVECIPLIVASILSKKLAEGIDALVLDVKTGRGAFMKDRASARRLGKALVRLGKSYGKRVTALLTDMSTPIGLTIGNALETREAIEVLMNRGPRDTRELTLKLGEEMLIAAGVAKRRREARRALERALADGRGLETLSRMVHEHGGDARVIERPERLPQARHRLAVVSTKSGTVRGIDALALGLSAVGLGAGRARAEDPVDPAVGIEISAPVGTRISRGEPLAFVHAKERGRGLAELERVRRAFVLGAGGRPSPRVLERFSG